MIILATLSALISRYLKTYQYPIMVISSFLLPIIISWGAYYLNNENKWGLIRVSGLNTTSICSQQWILKKIITSGGWAGPSSVKFGLFKNKLFYLLLVHHIGYKDNLTYFENRFYFQFIIHVGQKITFNNESEDDLNFLKSFLINPLQNIIKINVGGFLLVHQFGQNTTLT